MRWEDLDKEPCSLARTLSVIGDRWTLIILRECFLGIRRFEEFEERLGISRHVLAGRLKKLVENGVLYKKPYQDGQKREEYRLSEKGMDLYPIIINLVFWGNKYMTDEQGPPIIHVHKHCGMPMTPVTHCSACGEEVRARDVEVKAGAGWEARLGDRLTPPNRKASAKK